MHYSMVQTDQKQEKNTAGKNEFPEHAIFYHISPFDFNFQIRKNSLR